MAIKGRVWGLPGAAAAPDPLPSDPPTPSTPSAESGQFHHTLFNSRQAVLELLRVLLLLLLLLHQDFTFC